MRVSGYRTTARGEVELAQVIVEATPHELRLLASFLTDMAEYMSEVEATGERFGHVHMLDRQYDKWPGANPVEVIVAGVTDLP